MHKIGIVVHPEKDRDLTYLKRIIQLLDENGFTYAISRCDSDAEVDFEFCPLEESFIDADLVLTLGGDGTLLKAAPYANQYNVPLLGINLGHLGFLAEMEPNEIEQLPKILSSTYEYTERMMLSVSVLRNSCCVWETVALNDAVIRGGMGKPAHIMISDTESDLLEYFCDGFIVATSTGSTAYSMSAGGPILEPRSDAIVVTPICPHTLGARSVVFGMAQQLLYVRVKNADRIKAVLECDGRKVLDLCDGDVVCISRHNTPLQLVKLKNKSFYKVLNEKISRRML